ncbi:MAK16-like protein [Tieghemostelium lacteum]|uniref:Protein MAK16 homolog n=1 Tax=Tieghemostelium lacteum TaxID=361077 RepID=A0A152A227_TIELA|nr:MAK16-like protein [Tieghemostelium lacteum]|eukprot:KYR00259.1 MAK16-like protein [Tieghemostelium lacteum]
MQSDDIIWDVISKNFCSFKTTFNKTKFCRNEYNVTGVCNKVSCPLANSRYATVREENGVSYLYIKTIERAHTPAKLWEKIKLDPNFMKSIEIIDKNMEFWPSHMIHRVKQRYIRITQYLIRMRKIRKQIKRELVPIKSRSEQRDSKREHKAVVAAQLTVNIKKELLDRLKKNTVYGDLYYFPQEVFNDVLNKEGEADENLEHEDIEDEEEEEVEMENEEYDEEEEEEENGDVEYVEGDSDDEYQDEEDELDNYRNQHGFSDEDDDEEQQSDSEEDSDEEDYDPKPNSKKRTPSTSNRKGTGNLNKKPSKPRVNIEYETEPTQTQSLQRN